MNRNTRGCILLLITALIWGTAFVAQSTAMDNIGPLLFVVARFLLGGAVLLPFIFILNKKKLNSGLITKSAQRDLTAESIKGGMICGLGLLAGTTLQQYGLITTSAGKSAFITALYIIIVPIAGTLIGKRISKAVWISVVIAIIGFYLLCIKDGFSVAKGDFLCLLSAFAFTFQILFIDHFMEKGVDPVILSCTEFFTVAFIAFFPMLIFEGFHMQLIKDAAFSIFYCGVMSSGVAYTLQVIGQRDTDPAIATLIMSLESVFAALSGWLLLHEQMTARELIGCAMVFAAVLIAQLSPNMFHKKSIS